MAIAIVSTISTTSLAKLSLEQVQQNVEATAPGLVIDRVEPTDSDNLYHIYVDGRAHLVFVDETLMIVGDFYRIGEQITINEQIQSRRALAAIKTLDSNTTISFGDADAPLHVTMFTDIDCGYCRKMQSEMASYNDAGIRITEILFPAAGPDSESWMKAENVWCADDRAQALTKAKRDEEFESSDCDTSGLMAHFQAGIDAGLVGTPLMVADDGSIIQGYVPAQTLAARLQGIQEAQAEN